MSEHELTINLLSDVNAKLDRVQKKLDQINSEKLTESERLLSREELAKMTGMSMSWAESRADLLIPRVKIGGSVKYRLKDVQKYIEENTSKPI